MLSESERYCTRLSSSVNSLWCLLLLNLCYKMQLWKRNIRLKIRFRQARNQGGNGGNYPQSRKYKFALVAKDLMFTGQEY